MRVGQGSPSNPTEFSFCDACGVKPTRFGVCVLILDAVAVRHGSQPVGAPLVESVVAVPPMTLSGCQVTNHRVFANVADSGGRRAIRVVQRRRGRRGVHQSGRSRTPKCDRRGACSFGVASRRGQGSMVVLMTRPGCRNSFDCLIARADRSQSSVGRVLYTVQANVVHGEALATI